MIYAIMGVVIAGLGFAVFKLIQSVKKLKFRNDWMEKEHDLYLEMQKSYKSLLAEKAKRNKKNEEFIKTIDNSFGSDLADIANSM
jgi:predicted Holliday junction resolvase-like endonuclease